MPPQPPLNAARAFAVAGRRGSFAAAAEELSVTPAAVSQHVRNLEAHLGKQLFIRQGNRLSLTEAGQVLYPRLEALMGEFVTLTEEVRSRGSRTRLTISVSPSLGEYWLYPRLKGLDLSSVDVRAELDPVDFANHGIDLRLTYGLGQYPEHACVPLFADRIAAVCAPAFLDGNFELQEIADRFLIHTDWGPAWTELPSWRAWFAQIGLQREASPDSGLRTHLTGHAIAAAIAGLGVALVPLELARGTLTNGKLVIAHAGQMKMDGLYCAVWPHGRSNSRMLLVVLEHIGVKLGNY